MLQFSYMYASLQLIPILLLSSYICLPVYGIRNSNGINCFRNEQEALLRFKRGIIDDSCGLLKSWGHDNDCCQWHGVHCSNHTGRVIRLRLEGSADSSCLQGKISQSLIELKHLRYLDLSCNDFSHPIPTFLGSLTNLEHLNLSHARLAGEIPRQLGNLSKLTTLDLKDFSSLYVKNLHWLVHLRLLRYIDLSGASLSRATNWAEIVSNLPFLTVLRMSNCFIPARFPSSLSYTNLSSTLSYVDLSLNFLNETSVFQWLFNFPAVTTHLVYLDLSYNLLQGPFPNALKDMRHLTHLDLSSNHLGAPLTNVFQNMQSLSYLCLSDNNFRGSSSKMLRNRCNLQELYIQANYFDEELIEIIQVLIDCADKTLVKLDLSNNQLFGSIPDTISSFSSLRELYLNGNQLNGSVGLGIGQLSTLDKLDISSNSLQGIVTSEHFLSLSSLREFYSSENPRLVMNVSGNWIPPFQLDILDLGSCKLGPSFPLWVQTQTNLSFLDISNAEISDTVPNSFWHSLSPDLQKLNLSHNQLHGALPNIHMKFESLDELDLSSNFFEGALPPISCFPYASTFYLSGNRFNNAYQFLCPKVEVSVEKLDLSDNLLLGEVPDCWTKFDQLISLPLENNHFFGNVPSSMGTLRGLKSLHLYNNSLSGPLLELLENCTSLVILNVGYNSFTGHIPPTMVKSFPNLGALSLRGNKFSGELTSLCQLSHLQLLDLALNQFTGVIPKCIHNLTAMGESVDYILQIVTGGSNVGQRGLGGESQETAMVFWKREERLFKQSLRFVKSFDLAHNELYGEIPHEISLLKGLVSLDLSGNKLTGSITSDIGNLTALELFDLSNNHLTGEIPVSLAAVSSLEILNLSNNFLSGKIPLGTQLQNFDASSYTGNHGLCGAPLPSCTPSVVNVDNVTALQNEHDGDGFFLGLYISVVLGLIVGFWGVCGTLVLKRSWRYAYFRFLDDTQDKIFRIFTVKCKYSRSSVSTLELSLQTSDQSNPN